MRELISSRRMIIDHGEVDVNKVVVVKSDPSCSEERIKRASSSLMRLWHEW